MDRKKYLLITQTSEAKEFHQALNAINDIS